MIRSFCIIAILVVLASDSYSQAAPVAQPKKKHKMTDTVGVVNGSVIRLFDFRELLSDIVRTEAPDSIVQDTEFTRYVNMTWERLVSDILIYQEIERRMLALSAEKVVDLLIRNTPEELKHDFTQAGGSFDDKAYEHFLRDTTADSVRSMVINYFQAQLEQEKLMMALAPKARSKRERTEAFAAWLRKAFKTARIEDRRTAFGYY